MNEQVDKWENKQVGGENGWLENILIELWLDE